MCMTDITNAMKVKQPLKKEQAVISQGWEEVAGVPDVFKALDY